MMSFITSHLPFQLMFFICLPVTLLCVFGFCRQHSLWEMLIKLICLFFATIAALGFFEPLANQFDKVKLDWAYYNDMWAFIIIFGVVLFLEILATNFISRVNVQLPAKQNKVGAFSIMAVLFLFLYGVGATLFYSLLPEKPDMNGVDPSGKIAVKNPIQFQTLEYLSKGSLSGEQPFSYDCFFVNQFKRRSAVYTSVDKVLQKKGSTNVGQKPGWTFQGKSSPNLD